MRFETRPWPAHFRVRALLVCILALAAFPAAAAQKIFWGELVGGAIRTANADGTGLNTLITGLNEPLGIDIDPTAGKIYWTEFTDREVRRANLDGTSPQLLYVSGLHQPLYIAVDPAGGKMYWTDIGSNAIRRANLDGTGQGVLLSVPNTPTGIALDLPNSHLYWTEGTGATGAIKRANLDGTGVTTIFMTGGSSTPVGLDVDSAGGKIYWADDGLNFICRINTNGTFPEVIVFSGLQRPMDVALLGTKVYWVDQGAGVNAIFRADKNGANVETLINSGIQSPYTIAVLDNRSPTANIGGPYIINEGDTLNLDASASTDPDNDPVAIADWELNNDAQFDDAAGVTTSVDWATLRALGWNDGVLPISVRVSDGQATDTANTTVTVNNLPPNIVSGGPYVINEGGTLNLDATATSDPGLDALTFDWDLDDNGSDDVSGVALAVPWSTIAALGIPDGTQDMRLTVDDGAVQVIALVSLTIQNLPPDGQLDVYSVNEDAALSVAAPGVLGNDSDPGLDPLTITAFDTSSAYGAVVNVSANGAFSYDPRFASALRALNDGEQVTDTFQYTVSDGAAAVSVLVQVTVYGVPGASTPVPAASGIGLLLAAAALAGAAGIGIAKTSRKSAARQPLE